MDRLKQYNLYLDILLLKYVSERKFSIPRNYTSMYQKQKVSRRTEERINNWKIPLRIFVADWHDWNSSSFRGGSSNLFMSVGSRTNNEYNEMLFTIYLRCDVLDAQVTSVFAS